MTDTRFAFFGPTGRRITNLVASPNGQYLMCKHVPRDRPAGNAGTTCLLLAVQEMRNIHERLRPRPWVLYDWGRGDR